jgi:hypothetical protein
MRAGTVANNQMFKQKGKGSRERQQPKKEPEGR